MVKIQIKWGKEKYDYDLDVNGSMADFRAGLYSITFVPVDKQKIIFKGKTLKDETVISSLNVKEKALFMLMGAAEGMSIEEQAKPEQKAVFIEDLTPQQIAELYKKKTGLELPVGLFNLGNTCYMNSSLQCLRRINELKDYMIKNEIPNQMTKENQVTLAFSQLIREMDKSGQPVKPAQFVQALFNAYPQFAERDGQAFKQQDADECYMGISQCLQHCTPYQNLEGDNSQLMKDLFQVEYEITMKNTDIPDEKETISSDISNKLMCQIENPENPTNHMLDGLQSALEEKIEKLSDVDNQNHIYNKSSRIKKLPSYVAVQMQRFLWKGAVKEAGTEAGKVKILRGVSFPKILDVYSLCTPELQKSLDFGKEYEQKQKEEQEKQEKDRFENWKKSQEEKGKMLPDDSKILWKMFMEDKKDEDIKKHDEILYRPHGQGLDNGTYQLVAVLTHQGRSSDSGHYIGWIHRSGDEWIKYDDDKATEVKLADIMELKGGGDWHMGYYFFYRKIELL